MQASRVPHLSRGPTQDATRRLRQASSSGLTTFWLDESLRISPEEQEGFMVRLYEDALPVTKEAMKTVREILVQPSGVLGVRELRDGHRP